MKKLYNTKSTKKIHPSPPPLLSALPAALLTLAAALSADEQEALAYLLGCTENQPKKNHHLGRKKAHQNPHPPELGCPCFSCYKSFWARWDSSPNRHVIHLIIDAFEETLIEPNNGKKSMKKKNKRNRSSGQKKDDVLIEEEEKDMKIGDDHHDDDGDDEEEVEEEEGKSSVRKFVSWVFGLTN